MQTINGVGLSRLDIPDGTLLRIELLDASGAPVSVTLSANCVSSLIMTLPGAMEQMLRRRFADDTLRLVHPLSSWQVERASDGTSLILGLRTPDGFSVSFVVSEADLAGIGDSVGAPSGPTPLRN